MNTFDKNPTYQIVDELLDRIEHSNGLEFVGWDDILKLRNLLTAHLNATWTTKPANF